MVVVVAQGEVHGDSTGADRFDQIDQRGVVGRVALHESAVAGKDRSGGPSIQGEDFPPHLSEVRRQLAAGLEVVAQLSDVRVGHQGPAVGVGRRVGGPTRPRQQQPGPGSQRAGQKSTPRNRRQMDRHRAAVVTTLGRQLLQRWGGSCTATPRNQWEYRVGSTTANPTWRCLYQYLFAGRLSSTTAYAAGSRRGLEVAAAACLGHFAGLGLLVLEIGEIRLTPAATDRIEMEGDVSCRIVRQCAEQIAAQLFSRGTTEPAAPPDLAQRVHARIAPPVNRGQPPYQRVVVAQGLFQPAHSSSAGRASSGYASRSDSEKVAVMPGLE